MANVIEGNKLNMLAAPVPWVEVAGFLRAPGTAAALEPEAFARLVKDLREHALSALFVHRSRQGGAFELFSAEGRAQLVAEEARAKAAHTALMEGVERVLSTWAKEGLVPVVLKGLHLAQSYYPAPYLRPMTDMDALFVDLKQADRAWALAKGLGLAPQSVPLGADPWVGAHELPMLTDPATGFTVEVQGSLVYGVRDRRWKRAAVLLDGLAPVEVGGHRVWGLRPEANVVYVLAHNFVQHRASGPKLYPLTDVAMILEKDGAAMDWAALVELAERAGLVGPVALGLAWSMILLDAAVPQGVLEDLAARGGSGFRALAIGEPGGTEQDSSTLEELRNQESFGECVKLLWSRAFPSGAYMRQRYPGAGWCPLVLLYPRRWFGQVGRVVAALLHLK